MNVLVVGGGGREHALVWKIAQSPLVKKIYCAPGNPGIANHAQCVDLAVTKFDALAEFARDNAVDLTIIGPEVPLAGGIVDRFKSESLLCFGPTKAAARLEASKAFAKSIMLKYGIPTAAYEEFTDAGAAITYVKQHGAPIVIKADGLAAGKGVTVAKSIEEAITAIQDAMVEKSFGDAGNRVVVEECLIGEEASILAFTDGKSVLPLAASQDHKPVYDEDEGPNTGGMGAYSPAPVITDELFENVTRTILEPTIAGMAAEDCPVQGLLYAGLMITSAGPKVVEFNCRFGDPETQVVLPRMADDIVPLFLACCNETLHTQSIQWEDQACVSVVMASGGYPGEYEKGLPINGIDAAEAQGNVIVFHAGTAGDPGAVHTAGGRVLNVTALGKTIPDAISRAYKAVEEISFKGAQYRTDIGAKALKYLR